MPQPFCQLQPANELEERFIELVNQRDPETLGAFLKANPSLQTNIDSPWFSFDSPAILAAKHHDAMVDVLLQHGADINVRSSWWAGSFGVLDGVSPETAKVLLQRGAKHDIHSAAEQGEMDLVVEMLEADPSLVNARGGDGQTPLHTASTIEVTDYLLNSGAEVEMRCLDHSATAAQYAVSSPKKCRHLIACGSTPDIFMAIALGDRELVEIVLRNEPDSLGSKIGNCPHTKSIDPKSDRHIYFWKLLGAQTPLQVARAFGRSGIFEELYRRSPSKERFLAACWDGNEKNAKSELANDPDLFEALELDDRKLLSRAAWDGKLSAVETMLKVGFDPHLKGDEDSTPLDRAAFHGYREVVEALLAHDPNPPLHEKNRFGGVPLDCCAYGATHSWKKTETDHVGTAKALINAGAKIDPEWLPIEAKEMDQLFRETLGEA